MYGDSEMLREIVRDTTQINSYFTKKEILFYFIYFILYFNLFFQYRNINCILLCFLGGQDQLTMLILIF